MSLEGRNQPATAERKQAPLSRRPYRFVDTSEQDLLDAERLLLQRRVRARESIASRTNEQDPQKETIVDFTNACIASEFSRLGLVDEKGNSLFTPLQFGEVDAQKRIARGDAGNGVYVPDLDVIEYERDKPTLKKVPLLLHESLHSTGHTEFVGRHQAYGAQYATPIVVRNGYHYAEGVHWLTTPLKKNLKWLNEAVIETWTLRILERNLDMLAEQFPRVEKGEWLEVISPESPVYKGCRAVFKAIVERVANTEGRSLDDVYDEFFRGHVTGTLHFEERCRRVLDESLLNELMDKEWSIVDQSSGKYVERVASLAV